MPYAPHSRLTFSGIFGTTAAPYEAWSFRLNMFPVTAAPVSEAALTECLAAFTANLAPRIGSRARLTEIKHARIDAAGLYTDEPDILPCDQPGTALTAAVYPSQIAVAVSLDTATRGASGRGRFYLPNPVFSIDGSGTMAASDASNYASSAAGFLGALNAVGALDTVVVASRKGFNSPVTSVRVGRAFDTIRSRRTSISEGYSADVNVSQVAD